MTSFDLDAIRASAVSGPWKALALDECGDPFDEETLADEMAYIAETDPADVTVVVARGGALEANADGRPFTGKYTALDVLYRWEDIEEPDEVLARYELAKTVAEALNKAATATAAPDPLASYRDGQMATLTGTLANVQEHTTRQSRSWADGILYTARGPVEVRVFPSVYRDHSDRFVSGAQLSIFGMVDKRDSGSKFVLDSTEACEVPA